MKQNRNAELLFYSFSLGSPSFQIGLPERTQRASHFSVGMETTNDTTVAGLLLAALL